MMKAVKAFVLIFFLANSVSLADYYAAPLLKSDWRLNKSFSFCQLKQDIQRYGTAEFTHKSGELLRFSIREKRFKPEILKASLVIDASPWSHISTPFNDYPVYLDLAVDIQNYPRLSVYGDTAEIMLNVLSKGMYPTFTYVRAGAGGTEPETSVAVSSVNFLKTYDQFIDCRKDFLPAGLKTELQKSLFFRSGSNFFSTRVYDQLNKTARYVKEVPKTQVVIMSDTAIAGKRDKKWFLNRANAISNKLYSLGVPKNRISIKSGVYTAATKTNMIQLSVFGPDALKAIYYRKGNTKLTETEKQRLDLLVKYSVEFLPNSQLVINSHTDSKGTRADNLQVSQKRGDEIKRYLVSKGMDERKVQVKAYGESKPAKSNRFPTGRAQNRRAIINFIG